jgi:hypothetical protein
MRKVVASKLASLLTYLFSEVLEGRNVHLADEVEPARGRESPRTSLATRETPPSPVSGTESR